MKWLCPSGNVPHLNKRLVVTNGKNICENAFWGHKLEWDDKHIFPYSRKETREFYCECLPAVPCWLKKENANVTHWFLHPEWPDIPRYYPRKNNVK